MTINLTNTWAPQLQSGLPDPASPASARKSVTRSFHVNANQLEHDRARGGRLDLNNRERDNMTWGIRTRAAVLLSGPRRATQRRRAPASGGAGRR